MPETLLADIRYALRWLRRSPGFTAIAVASLAIGIGFNTTLFTLVDAVLFRPLPVERADRLVDVYTTGRDGQNFVTSSYPDYQDLKAQNRVFSDMLAYSLAMNAVNLSDRSRLALGEVVSGNYFQLLGVRAAIGRMLLPGDDVKDAPRVVVISYKLWARDYGSSPSIVGQTLRMHGQLYTIVGVAPRSFTGAVPILSAEMWTPLAHVDETEPGGIIDTVPSPTGTGALDRRGYRWLFVKGRLNDNQTLDGARANLQVIMQQLASSYPQTNKDRRASLIRTSDVHLHPQADKTLVPIAAGLMIVVGLVLLVACANVASMLLARASGRQKEIGIRLAIGASRRRLVQQLLTESVVLATLGALGGIALAWALTRAVLSLQLPIPIPLSFALQIDGRVLAFTIVVSVLAGVVAGLAPALKATKPNLAGELKGDVAATSAAGRRWTLRDSLVALQMAVTLVLLVTAGLLTRSLVAAQHAGIGFQPEGVALVSTELGMIGYTPERGRAFYDQALARVRAIPGVAAAGLVERSPLSINYSQNRLFFPERSQPDDKGTEVDVTTASPEYFSTLGVPILQGRNFAPTDTADSPGVVVVNQAFARKFWPAGRAIGTHVRRTTADGKAFEIVGIVADYKVNTVGEAATPYVHFAYAQRPDLGEAIIARTHGDASALVDAIRRALLGMEPNLVFIDNQTMTTQVGATLLPAKFGAMSVSAVGVIAMALAAIGLYGVIAYSVARRTREIGIRMALGAQPERVLALIMRQGLTVAAAGAAGGVLLALGAAKAVSGALYGVSPVDPVAWAGALGTLVLVSVLANMIPARRASRVDPSVALRSE
ncbi:MAG TPA: ABC transporter permease [Vicinamibacterales bacterium]|nr:ABC transporter permease [Vicinamibacterales bacterium]